METFKKISLPVAIVLSSIIFGSFYLVNHINEQRVEKIKRQEIKQALDDCLKKAEQEKQRITKFLFSLMEENSSEVLESRGFNLSTSLDNIKNTLQQDQDKCYQKYPQL